MRYAQIRSLDISNGEGVGVALFVQGCPFHCKNCFNPETWDFNGGNEYTQEIEELILELINKQYIKRFSILGGEPLSGRNIEDLIKLTKRIKNLKPDIKIWLYTGNQYENIKDIYWELLSNIDILIDGQYIDKERDMRLKWRGSRNQRVIDVQKSLKEGKVNLYID